MLTIQRSSVGVQFIVQINNEQTNQPINLSSASSINFIYKQPDQIVYNVSGSLYTDGTDGKVSYISQDTDLTVRGIWKLQISYQISGATNYTSIYTFEVLPNLGD